MQLTPKLISEKKSYLYLQMKCTCKKIQDILLKILELIEESNEIVIENQHR